MTDNRSCHFERGTNEKSVSSERDFSSHTRRNDKPLYNVCYAYSENYEIEIINSLGQKVFYKSGNKNTKINTQNLEAGNYVVIVTTYSESGYKKTY